MFTWAIYEWLWVGYPWSGNTLSPKQPVRSGLVCSHETMWPHRDSAPLAWLTIMLLLVVAILYLPYCSAVVIERVSLDIFKSCNQQLVYSNQPVVYGAVFVWSNMIASPSPEWNHVFQQKFPKRVLIANFSYSGGHRDHMWPHVTARDHLSIPKEIALVRTGYPQQLSSCIIVKSRAGRITKKQRKSI